MKLSHISIISVPVSDQERAKSFYVDVLGFEVRADASWGEGMCWIQVAPKDAQTSLTLVTWLENMPPGSLHGILIETDDVDGAYEELSEQGVNFIQTPFDSTGGRFASFRDPDGNSWLLHAN